MCGIVGWIKNESNTLNIKEGLVACGTRGQDATGIMYPEGNQILIHKNGVPADVFVKKMPKLNKKTFVIGHTRATTQGTEKKNENNHPHFNDKFILVHNGMISATTNIKEYSYKSQCDSENFVAYLTTYGWEGLNKIKGSGAVVGYDVKQECIFFFRETTPLVFGLYNDDIVFASTQEIAKSLFEKTYGVFPPSAISWWEVPENKVFIFKNNKFEVVAEFEFEKYYTKSGKYNQQWWNQQEIIYNRGYSNAYFL